MLVGRQPELVRLDALLDAARNDRAVSLVLRGPPGIGKTVLLDEAARRASGFRVLRAVGFESDAELPWAGLHHLLRPELGRIRELPRRQAHALRAALAIDVTWATDRFAVFAGALGLLTLLAEGAPLLCAVDDAHWLDTASAEALKFAARRLDADRVAMLFAARSGERPFVTDGIPELRLSGLEDDDARTLLAADGRPIEGRTMDMLLRLAAGNPLALRELPGALSDEQLSGLAPLDDPVAVGERLERAFAARVHRLSPRGRRAVLLAAAAPHGLGTLQGNPDVRRGLAEAEGAGLVRLTGGAPVFRHPMIRAAAYQAASGRARRAAHARLAQASGDDADSRAWHRAAAATQPDEDIARELEAAAGRAAVRGSMSTRARALESAARLTPRDAARALRLAAAGAAAFLAGHQAMARRLVDEAASFAADAVTRAEVSAVRWDVESHRCRELYPQLVGDAYTLSVIDPMLAARLFAYTSGYNLQNWEPDQARPLVERGWDLVGRRASPELPGLATNLAWLRLIDLAPDDAAALALEGLAAARRSESWDDPDALAGAAELLVRVEHPAARATIVDLLERAREGGSLLAFAAAHSVLVDLELADGRLPAAYRAAGQTHALAQLFGGWRTALGAAQLALVEAWLGSADDCARHVRQALAHAEPCDHHTQARIRKARGVLALGAGEPGRAIAEFERIRLDAPSPEHPGAVYTELECVEALFRSGRPRDARDRLRTLESLLERVHYPAARRGALRLRLFAVSDGELDEAFGRAFDGRATLLPLERARTRLLYGERLRRAGRRRDSREQLRLAEADFEELGAAAWVVHARRELRASGASLARRGGLAGSDLTPQERQIAIAVAEGMTNREIAAALYISPKTVEKHLSHVFRKLGVSSRRELVRASRSRADEWDAVLRDVEARTTTPG